MNTYRNISLQPFNTFGIAVSAFRMADCYSNYDICAALEKAAHGKTLCLGGGSNVLFTKDFDGMVIRPRIQGMDVVGRTDEHVDVRVGAGVLWDAFVEQCVNDGLGGVENLSGIPGTVGAAPVQNIGAYGAEAADTILNVEGLMTDSGEGFKLAGYSCGFGYRNSVFKQSLREAAIITNVTFRLSVRPVFKLNYGHLETAVEQLGGPSLSNVREAVLRMRNEKLPDPIRQGNAGSFFKNPEITHSDYCQLLLRHPQMPSYPLPNGNRKIPAAWLIDRCGWKGKTHGRAAVYTEQPLVIINLGGATGEEILSLADAITRDVKNEFGITLAKEVNIY